MLRPWRFNEMVVSAAAGANLDQFFGGVDETLGEGGLAEKPEWASG